MESWLDSLPDDVRGLGVSLMPEGVAEVGFPPEAALAAISVLRTGALPCLGGDEWIPEADRWRPSYENWYIIRQEGESDSDLVLRSWSEAESFVVERARPDALVVFVVGEYRGPQPVQLVPSVG